MVLASDEEIGLELLPQELREPVSLPEAADLPEGMGLSEAVARYERHLIASSLRRAGGVQKRAAELLGLKPSTLNEKIKRLGIRGASGI